MAEFLTASRFYFEAQGIEQKVIKEVSGLGVESTPAQEVLPLVKPPQQFLSSLTLP